MDIKQIDKNTGVGAQVSATDVKQIAKAGYRSIICNRPDGEGADQPAFAEIETAAKAAGLEARYIPVTSGNVTDEDAAKFGTALDELPKPVFAYCRTGTRSATLWSLSEAAKGRALPEILASTKSAGYDMAGVFSRIADDSKVQTDQGQA